MANTIIEEVQRMMRLIQLQHSIIRKVGLLLKSKLKTLGFRTRSAIGIGHDNRECFFLGYGSFHAMMRPRKSSPNA